MEELKRVKRELRYEGVLVNIYADTIALPDGKEVEWDYIHHDGAAAVVPVRSDGKILMVRQYRNALDRVTLEIPAGKVDRADEPKIECARRELEEETGYRCDKLEYLISVNTTVALCDELIEIYVARDLTASHQRLDEDEYVDVEACDLDELCRMIYNGELRDSKTVAAILAYQVKYGK
ncbi:MAG: NUDIX hydrolase [Lachnospiraceae bacterium]|nr:NUDIX hydrolase [Lachnospiraceae bacterium]